MVKIKVENSSKVISMMRSRIILPAHLVQFVFLFLEKSHTLSIVIFFNETLRIIPCLFTVAQTNQITINVNR